MNIDDEESSDEDECEDSIIAAAEETRESTNPNINDSDNDYQNTENDEYEDFNDAPVVNMAQVVDLAPVVQATTSRLLISTSNKRASKEPSSAAVAPKRGRLAGSKNKKT